MRAIGTIAYVTKGLYDPSVTYKEMDVVLYSGSLWEPKKETTGNAPPETQKNEDGTPASNEWWQLFLPGALGDDYIKKTDIAKAPTETEAGKLGIVMPDGKTIQIDKDGLLTGTPLDFMGTMKELQEGLETGEITDGMIGYIKGIGVEGEDPDHPNNMLIEIDDYLSLISSNAVQNRIISAALKQIKELADQNAQIIEETRALRASIEEFGLSKICPTDVTDVTEDNGLVLGAKEKNPSVEGTLSNEINIVNNKLNQKTNGRFVIPNGLKICWGLVSSVANGYADITFPVVYEKAPSIACTPIGNNTNDFVFSATGRAKTTGARIYVVVSKLDYLDAANEGFSWIAIGY